jgi:hypothetical protein
MKSFRKRASGFMFAAVMTVSLTSVLPLNVADAKATQTERITFAKGTSKTRIVRTARTTTMQFKLRFRG